MELSEARALAREKTEKDTTYRHLVSVEGVMRRLGRHFGEGEHPSRPSGSGRPRWTSAP